MAFPAALAFGWLGGRIGARSGIFIALAVYLAATVLRLFPRRTRAISTCWRSSIGLVQGGIQSLSRSYYGRLVPAGKSSEFFGFYNMMGKASRDPRPARWSGVTAAVTGDSRLSILSILLLFIAGGALLVVASRVERSVQGAASR